MQREIKFRAWNKTKKKMCDSYAYFDKQGKLHGAFSILGDTYIPLQYTGLKDHHGTDIYEGDIVNWFDKLGRNDVPFVVAYEHAQFILTVSQAKLPGRYVGWALDSKELEVIGNIYDNPELVKPDSLTP